MKHSTVQPREILPFAGAALIGLAAVLLPGPATDWAVFAIGAGLTIAIAAVGLAAAGRRRGRPLILLLPLAQFRRGGDPAALEHDRGDRLRAAGHAAEALEVLDRERHAAVLMDVQMPELDGYETTRRMRAAEDGGPRVPIIAMAAGALQGDRETALEAGMDDYLAKPLRPEALDAVLERRIGTAPEPAPAEPVFDDSRIRGFRESHPAIVDRLVALFADSTPPLLDQLGAAAHSGDDDQVRRLAHKLESSCDNVGAMRMAGLCRTLEQPNGDPGPLVDELTAAYPATMAEIRSSV